MLRYSVKSAVLVFFLVLLHENAKSQDLEVGLHGGGAYYIGDFNPGMHFLKTQPCYGVTARYTLDTRWAVRLSATMGHLEGNTSNGTPNIRDLGVSFRDQITDVTAVAEFNFLSFFTGGARNRISPYIFTGLSVFNSSEDITSKDTTVQQSLFNFSFPFGLGAKVSLTNRLGMQVYWEMHKTFLDQLDQPVNTEIIGDKGTKDWYAFFGLALTYKFSLFSSKKCRDLNH